MNQIEAHEHELGYPESQVRRILKTDERFDTFKRWMRGQTIAFVDGETIYYVVDFVRWYRSQEAGSGDPRVTD